MWLAWASLIAHLVGAAATGLGNPKLSCPQPAVPRNVLVGQPGLNITLPCLEGELENVTSAQWMFNGQNLNSSLGRQVVLQGPNLFLPRVSYNDSGHYSCYADGRLLSSLRLMVEEPPEVPNVTCFRRSLAKDIFCEWRTSRMISIYTKARLWLRTRFVGGNHSEQQCRYYTRSRKFSCRVAGLNDDNEFILQVSVCIVNLAGAFLSRTFISTENLLKPDPPVEVVVSAVEKDPNTLLLTWRKPPSWGSPFYRLQFQVRYRAETSDEYTEAHLPDGLTTYTIRDAVPGVRYVVKVRAREEFNHGRWSEWSREGFGMPWTEPKEPESEDTPDFSNIPFHNNFLSTAKTERTHEVLGITDKPAVEEATPVPLYTFLIMAVTVTVGLSLMVGVIIRYRKKWMTPSSGEEKPDVVGPPHSLTLMAPEPPLSSSPLLSPPVSPFSESSVDSPSILEHSPYDVCNADYFLLT